MAGQIPNQFNFGPYCLKTFPRNQAFPTQFPLFIEQQCLVDNLFHQPKTVQYNDIIHALVGHISNLNGQIKELQAMIQTKPTSSSEFNLGPLWHGKEKILAAENKAKSLRIFELEKEMEVLNKKIREQSKDLDLMKKEWEKELKTKKEYLEVFPEELEEVREEIRSMVMKDHKGKILQTQECLRNMARTRTCPFKGMAISILTFKEEKHVQQYCKCDRGLQFVQASIDLRSWQDVDSCLSFKNLFQTGIIRRVIVTNARQIVTYIDPVSYRLAHILQQILKGELARQGYINLEFESVPSSQVSRSSQTCYGR